MRLAIRALLQIKWVLILLECKFCELQDTKLPNPTISTRKQKQTSRHPDIRRNVKKTVDHNSSGQRVRLRKKN